MKNNLIYLDCPLLKLLIFLDSNSIYHFQFYKYKCIMEDYILQTKTRQQIADEFGISVKTLNRRLEREKIFLNPGLIFPKTLEVIYKTLGVPNCEKND